MSEGNEKAPTKVRKHIVFTGSVQGVGFRWRAAGAANMHHCTGWVKNEWDGSVSMEIQGFEEDINKVIFAIEHGTYIWIEKMQVKSIPVVEYDSGFRTR
ncbi:MAG: acylphosphatase [Clostridia bacterium]|nr:acylphosphatase [Clostridia bacterium]